MSVIVRFAPSPTGRLHVGNIRLALSNWLFAKQNQGIFLLRFDNTDQERSTQESLDDIRTDLKWLELFWDYQVFQSDRFARYRRIIHSLKRQNFLYPCYETAQELAAKRANLKKSGKPPIYDRAALRLTPADRNRLEEQGRQPHWRFLLPSGKVQWIDRVKGAIQMNTEHLSDPILLRENQTPLYTLCSVLDDIDYGITHVIRGEDHITNTAVQIRLWQALEESLPEFAHIPLLVDKDGQALSKRLDSLSVRFLRETRHLEPAAILASLATIGTSETLSPEMTLDRPDPRV